MFSTISHLASVELFWLGLGAFLIGVEKAGLKGLAMISVSIFALGLGGKASSGLLLLLFMTADIFAVRHYYDAANFLVIKRLIAPAAFGIIIGGLLGTIISDHLFKDIIAFIILISLGLIVLPGRNVNKLSSKQGDLLAIIIGALTGFGTMIANVSSPVLAIYLLALHLSKRVFIGTVVWFFFIVNILKLPFHIWIWQTIDWSTFRTALLALPVIVLGFALGLLIIKRIPERTFRNLILLVTLIAALKLLFS